ncbi:hypothetical protein EVAR_69018_1 [Eumeta japonica]|uniref:Uncharacterized protein n=1 Tax=Eumeta variegata TaxID=151549 RepID=A0A4C2A2B3_EUMVA|nr:hypothetical protein EVAR_69018_1 [Eumeta japonica]
MTLSDVHDYWGRRNAFGIRCGAVHGAGATTTTSSAPSGRRRSAPRPLPTGLNQKNPARCPQNNKDNIKPSSWKLLSHLLITVFSGTEHALNKAWRTFNLHKPLNLKLKDCMGLYYSCQIENRTGTKIESTIANETKNGTAAKKQYRDENKIKSVTSIGIETSVLSKTTRSAVKKHVQFPDEQSCIEEPSEAVPTVPEEKSVQQLASRWHWLYRRYCACDYACARGLYPLRPQSGDSCLLRVSALGHLFKENTA